MSKQNFAQSINLQSTGLAATIIKKRLNKIFQNSQFVLIWANFKSVENALIHQLEKTFYTTSPPFACSSKAKEARSSLVDPSREPYLAKAAVSVIKNKAINASKAAIITKITLPKEALNNYCLHLSLPIVGCGVDLLILDKKGFLDQIPSCEQPALTNNVQNLASLFILPLLPEAPFSFTTQNLTWPVRLRQGEAQKQEDELLPKGAKRQESTLSFASLSKNANPAQNFDRLLKTCQAALFMGQVLEEARNSKEKLYSNQLLGAFIQSSDGDFLFITSAELKQALFLQQTLKLEPKQSVKQPFIETLNKIKVSYSGQCKSFHFLLKSLISIINRSKFKLINNLNLASVSNSFASAPLPQPSRPLS